MHFKRGRPKNRRAGCLLCKPHKANGAKDVATLQVLRADASIEEQMVCSEDALDAQKRRCGSGEYICDECLEYPVMEAVEVFGDVQAPPAIVTQLNELLSRAFKRAA